MFLTSCATLTENSKLNITDNLKKYNLASVTPEIVTPETTSILITSNVKFDENATTKSADTIKIFGHKFIN